ncbi:PPOX class F420-dependent oxidoreductase [Cryobacterium arcticum]|uniref:PPOX class F420-dependent oxidoreductase n=1 Tax=Cryobacterium arcticum TaxID=670052 RepID=A0A317ZS17_9MICO|nr:PPOX class F420-dependent oxidoreductase [Cryobacterium arcticum]PXA67505.1 PPOX class F420-dependent oxidoreductase [Cryobacterium arcticum]
MPTSPASAAAPDATAALLSLADERFVSLTTYRKSGEPVSTPVWIARDGNDLIVTTPKESGKVKRLRNNARVALQPCSRMGAVSPGTVAVAGSAVIADDDQSRDRLTEVFGAKYKLEYRVFLFIERLGKAGAKQRVLLRISAPPA